MKIPKKVKRYCPYCKAHTQQKVKLVSVGKARGALTKGAIPRARRRGRARGKGSLGKYGKPAVTAWKRKIKTVRKAAFLYTCSLCGKSTTVSRGRAGRVKIEQ